MKSKTKRKNKKINGVRIIPLGGVQQIGLNSMVFETDKDMILVDAGAGFPDEAMYGVNFLIANYTHVYKNISKLKGIVLTHGHFDHIGALPYIVDKMQFPKIYGSRYTLALAMDRLDEFGFKKKVKLIELNNDGEAKVGDMNIKLAQVTHSIPDSCSVLVEAGGKRILMTGDFKFDEEPFVGKKTDYARFKKWGEEGVDLLMSDSTNSFHEGNADSDQSIKAQIEEVIVKAKGRVVAATFSSLVNRFQIFLTLAQKHNRKVFISGRSMETAYKIAKRWGYIKHPEDLVYDTKKIKSFTDSQILLITTGSQGEDMAGLARMARGEHRDFKVKNSDTILLSSSVIPGNGALIQRLIDELVMLGADVFHQAKMDVHTSGHGYKEDQKKMMEMTNPKFFMPVHGYQAHLVEHTKTAMQMGIEENRIVVPRNGHIYEFNNSGISQVGEVKTDPILIDGYGIGEIGNILLKERDTLAHFGIVIPVLQLDWKKFNLKSKPKIFSSGFVYIKGSKDLLIEIEKKTEQVFKNWQKSQQVINKDDIPRLKKALVNRLQDFTFMKTRRKPMVVPILV